MGVIYKLKPEVAEYILETKKTNPKVSCRGLVSLIDSKFQLTLSKSSINAIIKDAGLSMPVGRRRTKRKYIHRTSLLPQVEQVQLQESISALQISLAQPEPPPSIPQPIAEQEVKPVEPIKEAPIVLVTPPVIEQIEPVKTEPSELALPIEPIVGQEVSAEISSTLFKEPEISPPEPILSTQHIAEQDVVAPVLPEPMAPPLAKEPEIPVQKAPEIAPPPEVVAEVVFEEMKLAELSAPGLGAVLLKAADYLVGGTRYIANMVRQRLGREDKDLLSKLEAILYMDLCPEQALWAMLGKNIPLDYLNSFIKELQGVKALSEEIYRITPIVFQEARFLKAHLWDNTEFYFDGQLHTVWSMPQIPPEFSTTIYNIKSCINKYLQEGAPFVLFSAPGYDTPTREFFDFMLSLQGQKDRLSKFTLYDHHFEELETIRLEQISRHPFVFGLWPWQFSQYRKVKSVGEFRPFHFAALNKDFYLADLELELLQPTANQTITLRGCALKASPQDKVRLVILSNLSPGEKHAESLADIYLGHWPNLEEAFHDFSRKIERFTYTGSSQPFFSTESLVLNSAVAQDIRAVFAHYLNTLDLYLKWHFFPSGYEEKDFAKLREHFYQLPAQITRGENRVTVVFQPPAGYPVLKDLQYVCRRINEREVVWEEGRRLWLQA